MKQLKAFLLSDKNIVKNSYIWNMIAATSSSFISMIMIMIGTRAGEVDRSSYVAIGFASANLLMTVGKFGMRSFQVTDVREEYAFNNYLLSRWFTVSLMFLLCCGYCAVKTVGGSYSLEKVIVVFSIMMFKLIESFEDVYHGRLQQKGRLDIASKIWAIRNVFFCLMFLVFELLLHNLIIAVFASFVINCFLALFLNHIPYGKYDNTDGKGDFQKTKELLINNLPVAFAAFLLMYLSNAPKYTVDAVIPDEEQTSFNIIFFVIYVVVLMSNFVFNPLLGKLAGMWNRNEKKKLLKLVFALVFAIALIIGMGEIFAVIIGRRLLEIVFKVSLADFSTELYLLIISGGAVAVMNLMNLVIVMMRKQKLLYFVFGFEALVMMIFGRRVLINHEMKGLCIMYNIVLLSGDILLLLYVAYKALNGNKRLEG